MFKEVGGVVYFVRDLGGPGSGNFGHSGRPGMRGGSGSGGEGSSNRVNKSSYAQKRDRFEAGPNTEKGHWGMDMSLDEQAAFEMYVGTGYKDINSGLYNPPPDEATGRLISDMDSAMDRAALDSDVTVYSGLGNRASAIFSQLDEGSEVDFAAYLSTSSDENIARNFSSQKKEGRKVVQRRLKIDLPKGSKAFSFGKQSYEKEIVLPRGQKYRINKVESSKNKYKENVITYHVSVV